MVRVMHPLMIPLIVLIQMLFFFSYLKIQDRCILKKSLRKKVKASAGQNLSKLDPFPFQKAVEPYYRYTLLKQSKEPLQGLSSCFCMIRSGIVCSLNLTKLKGLVKLMEIAAPKAARTFSYLGKQDFRSMREFQIEYKSL